LNSACSSTRDCRIRTVKHGHLHEINTVSLERFHLLDDECRFLEIGRRLVDSQRLALAFGCPQVFAKPPLVVAESCVGGIEDVAVRTIVLFELDDAFDTVNLSAMTACWAEDAPRQP
jgi:hypothetical protein